MRFNMIGKIPVELCKRDENLAGTGIASPSIQCLIIVYVTLMLAVTLTLKHYGKLNRPRPPHSRILKPSRLT